MTENATTKKAAVAMTDDARCSALFNAPSPPHRPSPSVGHQPNGNHTGKEYRAAVKIASPKQACAEARQLANVRD
jgi:hypothetical protein